MKFSIPLMARGLPLQVPSGFGFMILRPMKKFPFLPRMDMVFRHSRIPLMETCSRVEVRMGPSTYGILKLVKSCTPSLNIEGVSAVLFSVPTDLYLQVAVEITLYVCGTLKQGELLRTLRGHTEGINSLVFSADGSTIISASRDDTIGIWDVATGDAAANP